MVNDILQSIKSKASSLASTGYTEIEQFVRKNPVISGAGVGTVSTLSGLAIGQVIKRRKSTKRKKKTTKRKTKRKVKKRGRRKTTRRKTRRKQKQPYTAGKRKDTSTRRIRYTKNNQPYIILKSGKARFIKRSTVRRARKRKGGMY